MYTIKEKSESLNLAIKFPKECNVDSMYILCVISYCFFASMSHKLTDSIVFTAYVIDAQKVKTALLGA